MIHAHNTTHPLARVALNAVAMRQQVGDYAARRYATTRGAGSLYRLALQLDAATRAGF